VFFLLLFGATGDGFAGRYVCVVLRILAVLFSAPVKGSCSIV